MTADLTNIRALTFDVFGTVVDWRTSIAREAEAMLAPKGVKLDWGAFADHWRGQYQPAMAEVREGRRDYVVMDVLHREMLDGTLEAFGVAGLDEPEMHRLTMAWRRLDPWPDAVEGMQRLKARFAVVALSNGNVALVLAMAKRAGIPWDAILGSELVRTYKPDAAIYDSAPRFLDLAPSAGDDGGVPSVGPRRREGARAAHGLCAPAAGMGRGHGAAAAGGGRVRCQRRQLWGAGGRDGGLSPTRRRRRCCGGIPARR